MKTLARIARVAANVLRGLADEDAYARYLSHHGVAHSPGAWRRFCEQRLRAKYEGGRCC
jgi:uncharacterized short protein YbdD (DUF466 family)